MKNTVHPLGLVTALFAAGLAPVSVGQTNPDRKSSPTDTVLELSPFLVEESGELGYLATQTLAGGRLRTELKNVGSSIQVITKEFMDDLGVTGVEELFQYTTSTEVGGILGNFTGASDGGAGETSTGGARRDPDGTSRVRGLAAPDRSRNYFKTDIPFDSFNTERIDINRGANSFLFGLGSPAGLANVSLSKARFHNDNEISTRLGSGGNTPSYRGSFKLNRIIVPNLLAIHAAMLVDRTTYRQEPTYKNDDRQYGAVTLRPFRNTNTIIRAYVENGRIKGNAPDVLLPQQNLSTFLHDPVVGRMSINAYDNLQRFAHVEGPTQAQWNRLSAADKQKYVVRNTPDANSLGNAAWGAGAYGLVFDGTNGRQPAFAYTDQYRAADYIGRDPFFAPNRTSTGAPYNVYHGNESDIKGTGWLDQGFTDLKTMDFSKANLGWDNDYYTRDFVNYNVALEQVLARGRAGFEVAYDSQDLFRRDFVAFNGGNSRVLFDINETLWLPTDPNYKTSKVVAPMRNPNYGRPFILTKGSRRTIDTQREAVRFTGFAKYDFAEHMKRGWLSRLLGSHTVTLLADRSTYDEKLINWVFNSFGDPEPALHIGEANARQTANNVRNVPIYAYLGPAQPQAFTDPNFKLSDFVFGPANYQLQPARDASFQKLSWNLGPDATNANIGDASRANGNEGFVLGTFTPREVPARNYRLQHTKVTSVALNTQSFFWERLLVVNAGYREDTVKTWLNTEANLVGLDEIPDLSPDRFRAEDGDFTLSKSHIFGYGGVLSWPRQLIKLPRALNLTFHYNQSENFIPATDRVDQFRRPVPSPTGTSRDYGVTVYLWDNKVVARLNWYDSTLAGATASVSDLFNQTNTNIFNHFGNLNRNIREVDADDDGRIDDAVRNAIVVDPGTGLTEDGLTRDAALAALYPNLTKARAARAAIAPFLTDELKTAYNYRMAPDGASQTQWAGAITDTNDIEARGFEAEITLNPSRNWRIAFNAAKQETILTNIAPALTSLLDKVWVPHLTQYGDLDWNLPVEPVNGNTTTQQINDRLLDYYAIKGQEGKPQAEQRKWRFNLISRYQFSEGRLKGFSFGGALRWEDTYATGYPLLNDPRGLILPDVTRPYRADTELSVDLTLGYRLRIMRNRDWTAQLNIRNLQNWTSDAVTAIRHQPDGSVARVRFDPPLQILLTNTFKF
ncbi:MAG: TonB-dependent receptor plug domain-containing protein [Opitutaceae bacterium]|nr:TonB-dependent receptor plug domain-containing protein [Opitutaceae bacterium]